MKWRRRPPSPQPTLCLWRAWYGLLSYCSLLFIIITICCHCPITHALLRSPTCALDPENPCPLPKWDLVWDLKMSTILQPANSSGYFDPQYAKHYGLVSLDWSNARALWLEGSTCETTNIENCKMIKAVSPQTKCFIYHNLELALGWLESQHAVMYDEAKKGYFLQYRRPITHINNGTVYNEPRIEGDQYFWDFRNHHASAYFIRSTLEVVGSPYVDGIYTDDVQGIPEEHSDVAGNLGLTKGEVRDLRLATQRTSQRLIDGLVDRGKYNWQMFGYEDNLGPAITEETCVDFMRHACNETTQQIAWTMTIDEKNIPQSVAAFLIGRGPYAWLGYGWQGEYVPGIHPLLERLVVGVPVDTCREEPGHVFLRQWSKGMAVLRCHGFEADLLFPYKET